nr:unnamed protein product [Callosobruchus chinensis]
MQSREGQFDSSVILP